MIASLTLLLAAAIVAALLLVLLQRWLDRRQDERERRDQPPAPRTITSTSDESALSSELAMRLAGSAGDGMPPTLGGSKPPSAVTRHRPALVPGEPLAWHVVQR